MSKITARILRNNEKITWEYPCLGASLHNPDLIVLFSSPEIGTVLYSGGSDWKPGDCSEHWAMYQFTPFIGEICLSNG